MNAEPITFNGINASTGEYLLPPLTHGDVAALAQGEVLDPARLAELRFRYEQATQAHFGVRAGVDPMKLEEAGWGVIFAHDADPAIREALSPLLEHRRRQATATDERYYKEYAGADGHRPGESKNAFLARHGAGPGPVDPAKVPYYLLIVGDPEAISYAFQYQLDVAYAVGRIHFAGADPGDTYAKYAAYARSVVEAETKGRTRPRRAAFVGVRNAADRATQMSADHLVRPLAERMAQEHPAWTVQTVLGEEATKARLAGMLGGDETPALLFTGSHGAGFEAGDPRQIPHQGGLVCQDWPGPRAWQKPLPEAFYVSGDDLGADADVHGLIAFHFACYGAGTPRLDAFAHTNSGASQRAEIARRAFVAGLPQALLSHPRGGALAVIGHVERAWSYSFVWRGAGEQTVTFESAFTQLLAGCPVGMAFECFNERHAELSVALAVEMEEIKFGKTPDERELAGIWTANNDARGYAIIGDPAVRLMVDL